MDTMLVKILVCFAVFSWIGWIILFTGLSVRREKRKREMTERNYAAGVIVDHVHKESSSGGAQGAFLWYPVVEFTAFERTYRLRYDHAMSVNRQPAGSAVEVRYDGNDPTRFHLQEDPTFLNGGRTAMRIGLVWIAVSAAAALFLAVFVGGASLDGLFRFARRIFRPRR